MSEILERVALAIFPGFDPPTPYSLDVAKRAVDAADAYRAEEKRRNCKHHNRYGTGCTGIDGAGWTTWFCQECGASYDSRTPQQSSNK